MVGFGTYLIQQDEDAQSLVHQAICSGYRHIDTAEAYGNENGVGIGIKTALEELGISRDELFVTTKLYSGNEAWGQTPKTYEATIESLQASLAKLQLDYVVPREFARLTAQTGQRHRERGRCGDGNHHRTKCPLALKRCSTISSPPTFEAPA